MALVSVAHYLDTAYDADVEFVDGVLMERQIGEWLHSLIQGNILFALRRRYSQWKTVPALRTSVTGKGVPNIWLFDPRLRTMSIYRPSSLVEIEGDVISTTDGSIELTRDEIFAE